MHEGDFDLWIGDLKLGEDAWVIRADGGVDENLRFFFGPLDRRFPVRLPGRLLRGAGRTNDKELDAEQESDLEDA